MKFTMEGAMKRQPAFLTAAILACILTCSATAWANGEEFFAPAQDGKIDLVYFGRIKDSRTGRSITDSVYFLLTDKSTGLSFQFTSDKPGHYRSPDVGAAIKGIGEKVNVDAFEMSTIVAGYKSAKITRVPRKSQGTIEMEMRLDPVAEPDVATASLGSGTGLPGSPRTWFVFVLIAAALVTAKVVRTSGRLGTTRR
jgi:hypothetical protein